jgi:hypothetical protein
MPGQGPKTAAPEPPTCRRSQAAVPTTSMPAFLALFLGYVMSMFYRYAPHRYAILHLAFGLALLAASAIYARSRPRPDYPRMAFERSLA